MSEDELIELAMVLQERVELAQEILGLDLDGEPVRRLLNAVLDGASLRACVLLALEVD